MRVGVTKQSIPRAIRGSLWRSPGSVCVRSFGGWLVVVLDAPRCVLTMVSGVGVRNRVLYCTVSQPTSDSEDLNSSLSTDHRSNPHPVSIAAPVELQWRVKHAAWIVTAIEASPDLAWHRLRVRTEDHNGCGEGLNGPSRYLSGQRGDAVFV